MMAVEVEVEEEGVVLVIILQYCVLRRELTMVGSQRG